VEIFTSQSESARSLTTAVRPTSGSLVAPVRARNEKPGSGPRRPYRAFRNDQVLAAGQTGRRRRGQRIRRTCGCGQLHRSCGRDREAGCDADCNLARVIQGPLEAGRRASGTLVRCDEEPLPLRRSCNDTGCRHAAQVVERGLRSASASQPPSRRRTTIAQNHNQPARQSSARAVTFLEHSRQTIAGDDPAEGQ